MMDIIGIGVDIVEISRIRAMRAKHGDAFLRKCFTPAEAAYCLQKKNADESLAARFSAKEAVMKAIGTGWGGGVSFNNVEVVRSPAGIPEIRLYGGAESARQARGISRFFLSLSHSKRYAVAQVVAVK